MTLNGTGKHGEVYMVSIILITMLALAWITLFVVVCIQRLTIVEQRQELRDVRKWNRNRSFWDNH